MDAEDFCWPLAVLMFVVALVSYLVLSWFARRLEAETCPECGSKRTESIDRENAGYWHCRACNGYWFTSPQEEEPL